MICRPMMIQTLLVVLWGVEVCRGARQEIASTAVASGHGREADARERLGVLRRRGEELENGLSGATIGELNELRAREGKEIAELRRRIMDDRKEVIKMEKEAAYYRSEFLPIQSAEHEEAGKRLRIHDALIGEVLIREEYAADVESLKTLNYRIGRTGDEEKAS